MKFYLDIFLEVVPWRCSWRCLRRCSLNMFLWSFFIEDVTSSCSVNVCLEDVPSWCLLKLYHDDILWICSLKMSWKHFWSSSLKMFFEDVSWSNCLQIFLQVVSWSCLLKMILVVVFRNSSLNILYYSDAVWWDPFGEFVSLISTHC